MMVALEPTICGVPLIAMPRPAPAPTRNAFSRAIRWFLRGGHPERPVNRIGQDDILVIDLGSFYWEPSSDPSRSLWDTKADI